MRLVKLDEVIKIMENDIVLKAERKYFILKLYFGLCLNVAVFL